MEVKCFGCKVHWNLSTDRWGRKFDHGVLVARYTIRMRASSGQSKIPNINTLREDLNIIRHFNNKLKHKLKLNEIKTVDEQWTNLTKSSKYAVNKSIPKISQSYPKWLRA